jgi:serine/threonine-protein kinase
MSEAEEQNNKRSDGQGAEPTGSFGDSVLEPGGQIGPFRIEQELGRGAMGIVYLAHDSKLDRSVAIKSLPPELLEHATVRARFGREGRVLASLNHPNIATIYDELLEAEGVGYLVLEYVPGLTLAERIAVARVKPQEALSFAEQIAEAVAAAHEHGVIHRDLKPGNIKITPEGRIKVLDFGLAKPLGDKAPDQEQQSTVTQPGRILGTPAYMSPEQVRGLQIDARSDIWAFGCLVYEMLTGKVPFAGDTVSDTMAAILDREPDWHALPRATPANIQILLRRCLEKDPRRRLHDIADAAIEISETLSGALDEFVLPGEAAPAARFFRRDVILVALVCLIAGLLIAGVIYWPGPPPSPPPIQSPLRLFLKAPAELYTGASPNCFVAISPDSTRMVYVGESNDGDPELYMWSKDDPHFKRIDGTRNAHNPFLSPDNLWIGFFTDKQLKRVSAGGGEPQILDSDVPRGYSAFGSWVDEETIIYSISGGDRGLRQISVDAGQVKPLVAPDSKDDKVYYRYPQVLSGGEVILYSRIDPKGSSIWAYLPTTDESRLVLKNASYARYVESRHLIFVRNNVLMVAPFDLGQLKPGRGVRLVDDDVEFDYTKQTPQIAISDDGTTVYISGYELDRRELVWVDLQGSCEPLEAPAEIYEAPCLSPNGQRIAVGIRSQKDPNIRISVYNIELGRFRSLTTQGESCYPQWSPDGGQIAYWGWEQPGSGGEGVFCKSLGDTAPNQVAPQPPSGVNLHPYSWSENLLACTARDPSAREDIWVVDTNGIQEPKAILDTNDREYNPAFSPDGRWLAYVLEKSNELPKIYVRKYPAGETILVSGTSAPGATNPVWARDGKELYYISNDRMMMAVKFTPESEFPIGTPEPLFQLPDGIESRSTHLVRSYDVSDDKRFLMLKRSRGKEDQLTYVQNWFGELKRLAPPEKDK